MIGKMELSKPKEAIQQKQLADKYMGLIEHRDYRREEEDEKWCCPARHLLA